MARISIIAVCGASTRALGKDNKLLWHIPEDLKRFKRLTQGHPIILGRKTFESIVQYLGKPLTGRTTIVLTKNINNDLRGCYGVESAESLEEGIRQAKKLDAEEIFIGGGASVYEQAMLLADRMYLTLVEDGAGGDTYFPPYEDVFTKIVSEEGYAWQGIRVRFLVLEH